MAWNFTPRITAGLTGVAVTAACTVYFSTIAATQWPPLLAAAAGAACGAFAASFLHQARADG